MHNFLFYNGNKNKPKIFSNLLNGSMKLSEDTRKRIEIFGNEHKFVSKLERTYWQKVKTSLRKSMQSFDS